MGVATAVAIGGLAISAATTANSFIQASEQKSKQRRAEADAAKAMAEARRRLSINYAEERAIKKEPYELQREAMLSAGAQAIQAGVESERGAAATAGKVYMAQNEAQGVIRTAMGQELTEIEKEIIDEQSRLRDLNVQLDLGEVEGQQKMAADAQAAATAAETAGYKGITDTAQMGVNLIPLFAKTKEPFSSVTDFSPSGGQLTTSQSKNMINTTNPAFQSMASDRYPAPVGSNLKPIGSNYGSKKPQAEVPFGVFGIDWSSVGSDRKLKKNITKIGESQSGLNIYSFEYIDEEKFGKGVFQGVMSDEIPQYAVIKGNDGFDRVNYSLLDIEFKKI
jgi:hypothetical protein